MFCCANHSLPVSMHIQVPFPGRPHVRTGVPPQMFDPQAFMQPPQQFMQHSFAQAANTFVPNVPPPSAVPRARHSSSAQASPVATDDESSNGWIKESKVTKMTAQGTRESTIKKKAPDVSGFSHLLSFRIFPIVRPRPPRWSQHSMITLPSLRVQSETAFPSAVQGLLARCT